jgi:alanine racemase
MRPNRVTLDPGALAHNLALLRDLLPSGTRIWQVCKGDGYGLGTVRAAELGHAQGLRHFCAGTPDEALSLRAGFPDSEVLLFPGAEAADLPDLARQGITVTLHNQPSLRAVLDGAPGARFQVKLDTGLHRYGFDTETWPAGLEALRGRAGLSGLYTHLGQAQSGAVDMASARFQRMRAQARAVLGFAPPAMLAASHTLLSRPDLALDAADPGRALYGMVPPSEAAGLGLRPVVSAVTSRLIDTRQLSPGMPASFGYGRRAEGVTRTGTFPMGSFDGLPGDGPLGCVLVRGVEAPVLSRTLLATIVDLTDIPSACEGDVVILAGEDGGRRRDLFDLAESVGSTPTRLHFTLIRALPIA